jgi:membrane protease YdiL (CAAX protease family)
MGLKKIFINDVGRLRSGFRLAFFCIVVPTVYIFLGIAAQAIYFLAVRLGLTPGVYAQNLIFRLLMLSTALVAGYFCNRLIEELPWRALGASFQEGWLRDLLIGSAIGILSLAFAAAIAAAAGGLRFTVSSPSAFGLVLKTLITTAVLFIIAAFAEEALFRGYPLQTLCRARLAWLGILLTSLPFAAIHLRNPNVIAGLTFTNTALAGVWLAVAYLRTRNLWFPLGVHWAWNWALGSVFGLPVSGINLAPQPILQGVDHGPVWLTGGNYGIEGGLACTITLLLSTLVIWRIRLVSATPEMLKLTSQENPKNGKVVLSALSPSDDKTSR